MGNAAKKILVTGASGFIGSRCVPLLAAKGYEIHAVTSHAGRSGERRVTWHCRDLLDPDACVQLVESIRPTHLLHLAWIAVPGRFWTDPSNLQWLASGIVLAQSFFHSGGRRAIGVGTCAEYAWGASDDLSETASALKPATIYGQCKLALALAWSAAAASYGRSAAWARLFFPYGPSERGERLIPSVISSLLQDRRVDCTTGTQIRDFIYVDDVAAALLALVESTDDGPFNIGTGIGTRLADVIAIITAKLGHADLVHLGTRARPAGDPDRVVADNERLVRQTGWRPIVALEVGIDRTIAAWRERLAA